MNRSKRKGIALIMAIMLMAVLTVILTVVTLQIVSQRQVVRQRQRHLQADWLARAGIESAAARLLDSPAAFTDDKQEPETKLHIVVEKSDADLYLVTVEAQVGLEGAPVARAASARFRRTDRDGVIRLEAVDDASKKR